jgi:hypothetical protein
MVPNPGITVGGDNSNFVFFCQKLVGEDGSVRRGVVMVKQPGLFSPKLEACKNCPRPPTYVQLGTLTR